MLTDGDSDLQKHMVFTNFGTCLLGPLLIAALIGLDLATEKPIPGTAVALPGRSPNPSTFLDVVTVEAAR